MAEVPSCGIATPPAAKKAKLNNEQEEEERVFCAAQLISGALDDNLDNPAQDRGRSVLELFHAVQDSIDSGVGNHLHTKEQRHESPWTFSVTREILGKSIIISESHNGNNDDAITDALGNLLLRRDDVVVDKDSPSRTPLWKLLQAPLQSLAHALQANYILEGALTSCNDNDDTNTGSFDREQQQYISSQQHLIQALTLWPCNPSALLVLANLVRMGHGDERVMKKQPTGQNRLALALDYYQAAAKAAYSLSQTGHAFLQSDQYCNDDKFLVETLLCEAAQVEMDDNNDDKTVEKQYKPSKVLVTATLMSATMASTLGSHEIAARALRRFGPTITRIHPNVWKAAADLQNTNTSSSFNASSCGCDKPIIVQGAFVPCMFPNAVPEDLFDVLRHTFRPYAPYWKQSGYDRNEYYSFWTDWPLPRPITTVTKEAPSSLYVVSNAVEHYVVTCLLPRVRAICPQLEETLRGFEWWVHTRPHGANLGHQLHFDTDEALLEQDETVEFPISASITYLNQDKTSYGPTILFDQTPSSKENASTAWICAPKPGNFMLFPGDLLHGVLPCAGMDDESANDSDKHYRLTFMVNFWAYCIPDRLKHRKLYGPSGPFPPRTKEHSWVEDICNAYPQTVSLLSRAIDPSEAGLQAASPAWECLSENNQGETESDLDREWAVFDCETILQLPPSGGINQRFFVTNAPDFFKATLFEK